MTSRTKPLSASPQTARVSSRLILYATVARHPPSATCTFSASQTQPEMIPMPVAPVSGPGFSRSPFVRVAWGAAIDGANAGDIVSLEAVDIPGGGVHNSSNVLAVVVWVVEANDMTEFMECRAPEVIDGSGWPIVDAHRKLISLNSTSASPMCPSPAVQKCVRAMMSSPRGGEQFAARTRRA